VHALEAAVTEQKRQPHIPWKSASFLLLALLLANLPGAADRTACAPASHFDQAFADALGVVFAHEDLGDRAAAKNPRRP
jgi:hypothetical protein